MANALDRLRAIAEQEPEQKPEPAVVETTRVETKANALSRLAKIASSSPEVKESKVVQDPQTGGLFRKIKDTSRDIDLAIQANVGAAVAPATRGGSAILGLAKQFFIDPLVDLATTPLTTPKVLSGTATPEEEQSSRTGLAFGISLPAGAGGAGLGALAGAPLGPIGAAVGAGIGAGLLGGTVFQALETKDDTPRKAAEVGLIGGVLGGVTGGLGRVARIRKAELRRADLQKKFSTTADQPDVSVNAPEVPSTRVPPEKATVIPDELKTPTADEIPVRPESPVQAELSLGQEVVQTRLRAIGSEANAAQVAKAAGTPNNAAKMLTESAKRHFVKADNDDDLRRIATEVVWNNVVTKRKLDFEAAVRARDTKRRFTKQERQDMTFFREGTENPFLDGDTPERLAARLSPEAKKAVSEGAEVFERMRQLVNSTGYGQQVSFLENYISHLWVLPKGRANLLAGNWIRKNPFASRRKYSTFVEGMRKAGLTPRTTDFAEILQHYTNVSARVMANNRMMAELRQLRLPDGVAAAAPVGKSPPGYRVIENPAFNRRGIRNVKRVPMQVLDDATGEIRVLKQGRDELTFIDEPMAVHPEIFPIVNWVAERPFDNRFVRTVETFNAFAKKAALSFSGFHFMALTEQGKGALGFFSPKFFLPVPTLTKAARQGLRMMDDPVFLNDLIEARITVSAPSDAEIGVVRRGLTEMERRLKNLPIPGLDKPVVALRSITDFIDDALWNKYYNGLKAYTYYELKQHFLQKYPTRGEREISLAIGEHVNNTFGGQNWDRMFGKFIWSPKVQQTMRWLLLAPDWTFSVLQTPFQAARKDPVIRQAGQKQFLGQILYMFIFGNTMNWAFTALKGDPHFMFENDPDHKFDVELPWRNEKGRKVFLTPSKAVKEQFRWLDPEEAIKQFGNKLSPGMSTSIRQLSKSSPSGFPADFHPDRMESEGIEENTLNLLALRAKDIGENFIPFSLRGNNAFFSFPMSQGTTPFRTIQNMEAAILDMIEANQANDLPRAEEARARIAVLAQVAVDNNIDANAMANIAKRNAIQRFRKRLLREPRQQMELDRAKERSALDIPTPLGTMRFGEAEDEEE